MSIIRVSGSSRGKINRVYGSSNYTSSVNTFKNRGKKFSEKDYYTHMISVTKSYAQTNKRKKYISKVQKKGKRLAHKTLHNILKAYKDTIPVKGNITKELVTEYISASLMSNLRKYKVPSSTAQKILKYDPHYKEEIAIKIKKSNQIVSTKKTGRNQVTKRNNILFSNTSYFQKIINFSYKNPNEGDIDNFINTENKPRRILSDTLVRNIIKSYKLTLSKSKNNKEVKRLVKENLKKNLLKNGVHPDTVKIILQLDINYR